MMNSGIYIIENSSTGAIYIGSAVQLERRWRDHRKGLNAGKHGNKHLQRAWVKYGAPAFSFRPLLYCAPGNLLWFEQRALDVYIKGRHRDSVYNQTLTAGSLLGWKHDPLFRLSMKGNRLSVGMRHGPEARARMSAAHMGHAVSAETRAKIGAAHKANPTQAFLGRHHTPEECARISERKKGNTNMLGKKLSEEARAKIAAANARRVVTEETRSKLSNFHKGRKASDETRLKMSLAHKARRIPLIVCLFFGLGLLSTAQAQADDPIAKALEQAVNRLAVAEEKSKLLEARIEAKDATIKALEGVVSVRDEQLKLALDANRDRAAVNTGDARMLQSCELQLSKADAEIHRLRYPGFFRSLFDPKAITGAAVGFGVGRLSR